MAEKWECLSLKATNWRLILSLWQVGDVFTCKLCSVWRTLRFSVLLLWWNANIWEPQQSNLPWTYVSSPLLPYWLEPGLGVYGLDVNSEGFSDALLNITAFIMYLWLQELITAGFFCTFTGTAQGSTISLFFVGRCWIEQYCSSRARSN